MMMMLKMMAQILERLVEMKVLKCVSEIMLKVLPSPLKLVVVMHQSVQLSSTMVPELHDKFVDY